ncbi:histidinol phosphate phosphatase domain-containing protein [Brevibacillus sp. NPDC058079]|uniref:histidinol phosphate phosphatase domain-containing protein n=1 Tax=Brevibacillus sp. NPDC058079 TaxID=3346330 RepID=UPI0036E000B0
MKVDFHVHLEEGPYSLDWLLKQAESLRPLVEHAEVKGSRKWASMLTNGLAERLQQGPYSRDWLELYRLRAKQAGIQQVCVVEHLYRFLDYRSYYEQHVHIGSDRLGTAQRKWLSQVANDSLDSFVVFLQKERLRWAEDGIELRVGIELDYFSGGEETLRHVINQYPWDVCIGAVHFLEGWGYPIHDARERFGRQELIGLYSLYFDKLEQAIESQLFDVIAHIDGIKAFGVRPDETALLPYYQRVARALGRSGIATEINTGYGLASQLREFSPSYRFLEILFQNEVPITLASSATAPDQVGQQLDEARAQLKRVGYTSFAVFEKRKRSMLALD